MRELAYRKQLRREAAHCKGIAGHAARLALGDVSRDEFLRATADDWRRLARTMHNGYRDKLPDSLGVEDLSQEMQLEAMRILPTWKPDKASIGRFLVYNACAKARKILNKERQAQDRDGKKPSRFPIPASRLSRRGSNGEALPSPFERASVEADQEQRVAGRELYRELRRGLGRTTTRKIEALREGGAAARAAIRAAPWLADVIERVSRGETEI